MVGSVARRIVEAKYPMTAQSLRARSDRGQQCSRQRQISFDIFCVTGSENGFKPGRGGTTRMPRTEKITGISAADGQILSDWLGRAGTGSIHTIIDFTQRQWKVDGPHAIIGVFERESDKASWLIMRYRADWILMECENGLVSDVSAALPDILAMIDASDIRRGLRRPI